ncbi:MAG: hypothetical protein ACWIPI_04560 [Polaribacter sp.]
MKNILYQIRCLTKQVKKNKKCCENATKKTSDLINDGEDGTNPFITDLNFSQAPIYGSMQDAVTAIGLNKVFRYSETNSHGVVSPFNSVIGITSN